MSVSGIFTMGWVDDPIVVAVTGEIAVQIAADAVLTATIERDSGFSAVITAAIELD